MLDRANKIAVLFESVHGQKLPDLTGKGYSIGQPLRREPVRYARWAKMLRYVRCIGLSKDCVIKMQTTLVASPRNHQGRTATSRRGGGRFLSESQDLGQCTHDGDLAAAARLAGQDFDPIDNRADGFDDLRACRLVLQRLLKFPYLFTIELWKIGMDNDPLAVLSGHRSSIEISLASLKVTMTTTMPTGAADIAPSACVFASRRRSTQVPLSRGPPPEWRCKRRTTTGSPP